MPALDSVLAKLSSFIDTAPATAYPTQHQPPQVKDVLSKSFVPYLKARFPNPPPAPGTKTTHPPTTPKLLSAWSEATTALARTLPPAELFPLIDVWRLAILDPVVAAHCAATPAPLVALLLPTAPRASLLTALRLLCNACACAPLFRALLGPARALLVPALLHADAAVRTAAAGLAFNAAALVQVPRVDRVRRRNRGDVLEEDEEWEVEMVSAVVEALEREKGSEDVGVSRLFVILQVC